MPKETFNCPVVSVVVVDGDTQHVILDRGWRVTQGITTRLVGIDAPENGTDAGKAVSNVVKNWLTAIVGTQYRLRWLSRELDMYGRSIGDFIDQEHPAESLTAFLRKHSLAKAYDGKGKRQPWTPDELSTAIESAKRLL